MKDIISIIHVKKEKLDDNILIVNTPIIAKCHKGAATVNMGDAPFLFSRGAHFLTFDNLLINVAECSDDFEATLCQLETSFYSDLLPFVHSRMWQVLNRSTPSNCKVKKSDMLDVIFTQLVSLVESNNLPYGHNVALYLLLTYKHLLYNALLPKLNDDTLPDVANAVIANSILDEFFLLCNKHYLQHRNVAFYANQLHITPRHLYNITMNDHQATPKAIIDSFVIGAIKKLLFSSSLSIQQIAFQLNFPDQSTLRQFFKRNVGVSPTEYRNSHKLTI